MHTRLASRRSLFVLALLALAALGHAAAAAAQVDGRFLAKEDILLYGLRLTVAPDHFDVPRDIAFIVSPLLQAADEPGAVPDFAPDAELRATLRGPSFPTPVDLVVRPNTPFNIPAMKVPGLHVLDNIRLVSGGEVLMYSSPESVKLNVIDKLLVTQVTAKPLTADQIRELNIVFDRSNFQAYNFAAAFAIEGNPIQVNFPILLPAVQGADTPNQGNVQIPGITAPALPNLKTIIPDTLKLQTQLPNLSVVGFTLKVPKAAVNNFYVPPIPGIVAIPGDIGFLNQYFSVMLMVGNGAPTGSNLVVSNLSAEIKLPIGGSGPPLAMAQTTSGQSPMVQIVRQPGPDGKLGTADDINTIGGGESGQADFLVEGKREGSHIVEMKMTGTLLGLPGGPVAITGTAAGAVLVRNPKFTLTFTHPEIVTAGESYTLDVTVTNTSISPANFVSINLHPQHVGGADVVGAPSRDIDSIAPGDSATVSFTLKAKVTGRVTAATLDADDNVAGRFALKTSVGELGVPLSPDSLVLPKESSSLPADLRNAAIGLLGKAWAVATAPAAAVPRDLQRFSTKIVLDRAVEVAEAGLRKTLNEPLEESAAQLLFDIDGSNYGRLAQLVSASDLEFEQKNFTGFDLLRRRSMRGDTFADAIAAVLRDRLTTQDADAFHTRLGEIVTYRPGHISVLAYSAAGVLPVHLELTDPQGRRLGGTPAADGKILKDIPFSDYVTFKNGTSVLARMALVASPIDGTYALRFANASATSADNAPFTVSILVPGADGLLHHLMYNGVTASSVLQLPTAGAGAYKLTMAGTATVSAASDVAIQDAPPSVISAIQQANADIIVCKEDDVTGQQVGRIIAVLFSEEVTKESVQDRVKAELIANFLPEENAVVGVALQPGRRIAYVALRDPYGPLKARTLTLKNIKDLRGNPMSSSTVPMQATVTDPGGRIFGRVLAADGTPIPFANVRLFYLSPCFDEEDQWIGVSSKTTDANGFYSWDYVNRGLSVRVVAIEPGTNDFRDVRFGLTGDGQQMEVNIVFLGRGTLQGRTLKQDKVTPLANANIRVTSLTDRSQFGATTDGQGRFTIARVPVGNIFIEAVHSATNASFSASDFIPFAGATTTRDLVLLTEAQQPVQIRYGALSGYVLHNDGTTPVSGAPVIVYYQNNSQPGVKCPQPGIECPVAVVNTDATGKYVFASVIAGTLRLQSFDANSLEQGEAGIVLPIDGTATTNIILVAGLGTVRGKVVDTNQHGIANATVGGGLSLTTTNANGEFELKDVPVGHREIVAVSQALGSRGSAFVDIVRGGETVFATIVLDPVASVSGVVTRSNGSPAGGIKVYVVKRDRAGETIQVLGQAETAANGGYQIDRIPLGNYIVSAFTSDFTDGNVTPAAVRFAGEIARADIKFRGGNGKVFGKVLGDNGTPLKARVAISGDQVVVAGGLVGVGFERRENFRIVETGFTSGAYSIDGLFVGPFTLRAAGQFSPDPIVVEETLPSPGAQVEVNLQLQPTSSLKGTVYQPDGQTPIGKDVTVRFHSDAFITFCRESQSGEQLCESIPQGVQEAFATTDANGAYLFPIINPGSFTVSLEHPDGWMGIAKGTVGAGQAGVLDFRLLGRGNVTVEVRRSGGGPAKNAKVQVTRLEAPRLIVNGRTGDDGKITFSGADSFHEGEFLVEVTDVDGGGAMGRGRGVITGDGQNASVLVNVLSASGSVRGRLTKPDGFTPVPNAEVVVAVNGAAMAFALTNANGEYSLPGLPLGNVTVDAFEAATARRAFAAGAIGVNGDQIVLDLTQAALGMVRGRIFDARTLEPLRNWRVTLNQQSTSGRGFPSLTATSEIDGSFSFPGTSVGSFSILAQKIGVVGNGTATGTLAREGQVVDIPVPINIPRPSFGTITGLVRTASGGAVANARVEVFMRAAEAPALITADGDGKFTFGPTEIGRFRVDARPQNGTEFGTATGELSVDGDMKAVTIDLHAVSTISGVVMDGSSPAANVKVTLTGTPSAGCIKECTQSTNGFGQFTFTAVPATQFTIVAATLDGSRKGSVGDTITPGSPKSVTVVLEPSRQLGALVRFAGGDPAPGMVAEVTMGTRHFFAETGADGVFRFAALPLAPYQLEVSDPVGGGLAIVNGTLVSDTTLTDITLDQDPPSVANITPSPSATGVALTDEVKIRFSEPIDRGRVDDDHITLLGPSGQVTAQLQVSADDREVAIHPLAPLAPETRYRVSIAGIKDRIGKEMPAEVVSSFTTKDVTPPTIQQYTPDVNANGVSSSSVVRIKFSEAIDPTKFTGKAIDVRVGSATGTTVAGEISYGLGNTVVVFTPAMPLNDDTVYSVSVAAAKDVAGNASAPTTYLFSTTDHTAPMAPVLVALTPTVIESAEATVKAQLPPTNDVQFVDFYVNDAFASTAATPFVYHFPAAPALGAPGQSIKVTAIAIDSSGNRGASSAPVTIPVVADQPPAVAIQQPATGTTVKTGDVVKPRVHSTDDRGVTQLVFRAKVGTWQSTLARPNPQPDEIFEFTVPSSAGPNSTITLEATAVDAKGTTTSAQPVQLNVLDTAGPAVTITGATTGVSVKPGHQTTVVVTAEDPGLVKALTFKASGAAVYQADRVISPAQDKVVASFTFTVPSAARAPEQVTLEANATDVAGNVASATIVKLQVADVSAPSVISLSTSTGSNVMVPGSTLLVQATATDDIEVTQIALTGTGAFPVNQTKSYSGHNQESYTFSIPVPQDLPSGALLNLQARATDRAGNVSEPKLLTLTADALPTVSFANAPYVVKAGDFIMATFTLSVPAPAGGRTVTFTTDNAAVAEVATTVAIPAGQSSGTVKITANAGGSAAVIASIEGAERGRATTTVLGGVVRGIVTDPQGGIAIGAAVTVTSSGQSFSAQTDGEGKFEIQGAPGPQVTVKAFASGLYGTASANMAANGHATINVQLIDAAPVTGIVVKADGQTNAGANIKVSIYAGANTGVDPLTSVFTNGQGTYEFPLVETGSYTLEAYADDGSRARSLLTVVPGIEANVKLTFLARGTIKGSVRDALDHVVGADLTLKVTSLFGTTTTTLTTPDGLFQFDNVFAGSFTLTASRAATGEAGTESGTLDLDGQQVNAIVHLSAVGTLEGTVFRGTSIVPNATVAVGAKSTITNSSGHYELLIPAGSFTVEASVDSTHEVGGASGTIAAGQRLAQNITLEPQGTLVVTVTNFDNQPMGGAKVNVTGKRNGFTRALPEVTANSSGVAVVEHVLAETFTATGSANGMSTTVAGTLTASESKAVTIKLQGKSAITGTVFQPNGQQKATGGTVSIYAGGSLTSPIAPDGTYRIENVPLSTGYTLIVTDSNNVLRAQATNVAVPTPGVDVVRDFTLVGIGTVKGRVVSGQNGVSGVSVSVRSYEPTFGVLRSVSTDPDGYYTMTNVIAGSIGASAQSGSAYGELSGTLTHGGTLTLDLVLVPNSQALPAPRYDANNSYFDIQRGISLGTGTNGFYNAFQLDVVANGSPVRFTGTTSTGTQEDGGREIVNRQTIAGLNVTRKVFVPRAGYFGRWLEILSNPTDQPITVDLRVTTGIGASQRWGSTVIATSSGDAVLDVTAPETRDRWVVMDDSRDGDPGDVGGIGTTAVVFDGPGVPDVTGVPSRVNAASFTINPSPTPTDTLRYEWQSVTIAPQQTVAYMHFGVRQITRASASASAARLVQLPPEALVGLSIDEVQWIRNFAMPANGQSTVAPLPPINGTVTGQLIAGDHSTLVLPAAWVSVRSDSLFYPRTYSAWSSNGAFSFASSFSDTSSSNISISTGDAFTVSVLHPQTKVPALTHASFAPSSSTAVANLVFENTSILQGQVQRHTGAAAPNAFVDFSMPGVPDFRTTTGTSANYTITGIPVGTYTVEGSYTTTGAQFVLTGGFTGTSVAGGNVTRNISLVPTGGVKGRVKKADGSFPSGFLVGITADNFNHSYYVNTTSGGNFSFASVPVGNWTLFATDAQIQTRVPVTVVADVDTPQDLDLLAYRNVTAIVRFPDGSTPTGNPTVKLIQAGYADKTGSLVNGQYTFTNVPAGTPFVVRAWTPQSSSYYGDSSPQTITTIGTPMEVPVTLPAIATLRVTVMQGPDKGANVLVAIKNAFNTSFQGGRGTDSNGQISLTDVPQGPVQIKVNSAGNVPLGTGTATIQAADHGKTVDVTVSVGIVLPRTLIDANGFDFDIRNEGYVRDGEWTSYGHAYDSAVKLSVIRDGQTAAFANTSGFASLEADGRQLVIGQSGLQGLNVTRKIYVPKDGYFARYVDLFTNAGMEPVTVDVQVATDPASNADTRVVAQVPGQYLVTDDDTGANGAPVWPNSDPTLAHVYGGPGDTRLPIETLPAASTGVLTYRWNSVTIERGQTVAFMHFAVQQATQEAAKASAQRLVQLPPEAIANLTGDERTAIRNFAVPADGSSTVAPLVMQRSFTVTGKALAYDGIQSMNGTTTVRLRSANPIFSVEASSKQSPYTLTTAVADGWVLTADNEPPSPFSGWVTSAMPIAGVVDGSTTSVAQDIAFTNAGGVSGTVRFGNPMPLPSGKVLLSFGSYVFNSQLTDGKFNLLAVPAGTYTATATLDDNRGVSTPFTVTAGKSTDVLLELPARAAVQIAVKNPNGSDATHTDVQLTSGGNTTTYSNVTAPVTIAGVNQGPFTVTAYSRDSQRSAVVTGAVTRTDEGKTIVVTPRLNAIADVLVTVKSGDQAAPNLQVQAKFTGIDEFWWMCSTDEAGQCHIAMPEGDYTIRIVGDDQIALVSVSGHVAAADDGQTIAHTLQLPTDLVKISGAVYAADGVTPARVVGDWSQVRVDLVDVTTGSVIGSRWAYDGAYEFPTVPARSSIIVRAVSPFDQSVTVQQTVPLNAPAVTVDLTLPLSVIKGRVFRATGEPMPSYLQISSEAAWASGYTIGEDAHYAFVGLPAQTYMLTARTYARDVRVTRQVVLAANASVVHQNLIFNVVKGKVMFHDGEAVASPNVFAVQANPDGLEETIFPVSVTAGGNYEIEGVAPGAFSIVANALGLEGTTPGTMTDNAVLDHVNVTMEDDGTITGTFTTADGSQPIGDARVILSLPNVDRETSSDSATGGFEFKHVKLGAFALYAQDPATTLVAKATGTLSAAQHDRVVPLKLPQTGTVTGQVVSGTPPAGTGPAEVIVENLDNDGPLGRFSKTVTSDASGAFSASGVPVGHVSVMAFVDGVGGQASNTLSAAAPLAMQVSLGSMRKLDAPLDFVSGQFTFDLACDGKVMHGGRADGVWPWIYDQSFRLTVNNQSFPCAVAGALEDGGRELVIAGGRMNGLDVTRKIYVPADGGYARFLEVISNPGLSDKAVGVVVGGSIPYPQYRTHLATPDVTGQTYAVLVDGNSNSGQGFAFGGPNIAVPGFSGYSIVYGHLSYFQYSWQLVVPAGQTRILMHFAQQAPFGSEALSVTQEFPTLTRAGALAGMSDEEKAAVINYAIH